MQNNNLFFKQRGESNITKLIGIANIIREISDYLINQYPPFNKNKVKSTHLIIFWLRTFLWLAVNQMALAHR